MIPAPWGCATPASACAAGAAAALALDWWGIGHQATRDRLTTVTAAVSLAGLSAAAGWPGWVHVPGPVMAAGTAVWVTAAGGLGVVLASSRRAAMRRPRGRIAVQAWLLVVLLVALAPATVGRPVVLAGAWLVGDPDLAVGGGLIGVVTGWWLAAAGVRPWLLLTRPSGRQGHSPTGRLRSAGTRFRRSGSAVAGAVQLQRSRPVAAGRPVGGDRRDAFADTAVMVGEPVAPVRLARPVVAWSWRSATRRVLAWAPPDAVAMDAPTDAPAEPGWRAWVGRQLDRGAPTTEIIRTARRQWGGSERTWYNRLAGIRADRSRLARAGLR